MRTKTIEVTTNGTAVAINEYEDAGWAVRQICHVAPGKVVVVLETETE